MTGNGIISDLMVGMVSKEVTCIRGSLSKELAEEVQVERTAGERPRGSCVKAAWLGRMTEARSDKALEGRERSLHFIPVTWKASGAVETEDWLDVIFLISLGCCEKNRL